jgi:hypothetical protein
MPLKLDISVFSAQEDWLGSVVVMILTGGCSGSHLDTHLDTHRNTHKGTHMNDVKLDSNHRQPILRFFESGWVWLWDGPGLVVAAVR